MVDPIHQRQAAAYRDPSMPWGQTHSSRATWKGLEACCNGENFNIHIFKRIVVWHNIHVVWHVVFVLII